MVKQMTDHGRAIVLLVGLMTGRPALAQKVGDCTIITGTGEQVTVLVNQRQLTGEELHLYLDTCDQIDTAFEKAGARFDARMLRTLLSSVDALPGSGRIIQVVPSEPYRIES